MPVDNGVKRSFLSDYALTLAASAGNDLDDNYDPLRFGPAAPASEGAGVRERLTAAWRRKLRESGFIPKRDVDIALSFGLRFVETHLDGLQWLYDHLDEPESRCLLLQLVAYRALGHRIVRLPLSNPEHGKIVDSVVQAIESQPADEALDAHFLGWKLKKIDLRQFGYPLQMHYRADGVMMQFIDQQYRCPTASGVIEARPGNVVVDAGGCWADSALYFADKVGSAGKVFSFEFLPDNLTVYRRNLELNPTHAPRIELMPHPVWSTGDVELFVNQNGPGTTVTPQRQSESSASVRTMAIDQLLERPDCPRIDFIKMDIEGAEQAALRGAEQTLRTFRPNLAVTVYHSLADFWEIPQYIDQLNLGYRFYLRHFTIHAEETVLFATCEPPA